MIFASKELWLSSRRCQEKPNIWQLSLLSLPLAIASGTPRALPLPYYGLTCSTETSLFLCDRKLGVSSSHWSHLLLYPRLGWQPLWELLQLPCPAVRLSRSGGLWGNHAQDCPQWGHGTDERRWECRTIKEADNRWRWPQVSFAKATLTYSTLF